jgi:hypothetical protein
VLLVLSPFRAAQGLFGGSLQPRRVSLFVFAPEFFQQGQVNPVLLAVAGALAGDDVAPA